MRLLHSRIVRRYPPVRLVPIYVTSLLLALSLLQDVGTFMHSPLIRGSELLSLISAASTSGAIGLLLLLVFCVRPWLSRQQGGLVDSHRGRLTRIAEELAIWLTVAVALTAFCLFERLLPVSVLPFSTGACGILWLLAGNWTMRRLRLQGRTTLLAIGLLISLGIRFVDWNTQKPFIRDLLSVRVGMTRPEVERIMGRYPRPEWSSSGEDSYHGIQPDDTIVYRPSHGVVYADWGVVKFTDGKVTVVDSYSD